MKPNQLKMFCDGIEMLNKANSKAFSNEKLFPANDFYGSDYNRQFHEDEPCEQLDIQHYKAL